MKHQQWGQFALASPPKSGPDEVLYGVLRQPGRGLDVREILPPPVEGEECLLTSPSIGLSHSDDGYGYMSKPRNQNRTFHLLQKADILTCYEQPPRLKVAMLTPGMDCSVVALKRGNARGARGTGHPLHDPLMVANRIWDEPWGCGGRRQPSLGGTSRMTGDRLVRICEGSRVKFLRSTRRLEQRGRVRRSY